jgi:hypothetical protein
MVKHIFYLFDAKIKRIRSTKLDRIEYFHTEQVINGNAFIN